MLQQSLEELALRNVSPDWFPLPYIPAFAAAAAVLAAAAAAAAWIRSERAVPLPLPPAARAPAASGPSAPSGFGTKVPVPGQSRSWECARPLGGAKPASGDGAGEDERPGP